MPNVDIIEQLMRDPARTGILSDFDGTLSAIVDRPQDAGPVEGAADVMQRLADRFGLVAVVSGRSMDDLRSRFAPEGVVLLASYGRERSDRPAPRPPTGGWEPVAVSAAAMIEGMDGVVLERKGAGIALHYRLAPGSAEDVVEAARRLAEEFDLEVRPGRLVAELTVPGPGKGQAVADIVAEHELRSFLYAGDDVADLEVFETASSLDADAVLVAVASQEGPQGLSEAATLTVAGPHELVQLLRRLDG